MTSANAFVRFGISTFLLAGSIGQSIEVKAQSTAPNGATTAESGQDADPTVDRGKLRLQLLIRLVENEFKETTLRQSRLTAEASELDQERRRILAGPSDGTLTEQRRIDVIESRLEQIDKEVAEVNTRLPEINDELAELKARLDEANGIVREPETDTAANGAVIDSASRWLDSKRRVQEALVYLGGYNALIDGDFGPRTEQAIKVYQARQNLSQTGNLTNAQETALLEEADLLRARYGMTTVENVDKGYRMTYPSGLLPESSDLEQGGLRYASKDGEGELVITSSDDGEPSGANNFATLYDQLLDTYEVQYRRKRDNWFVVAGLIEEGRIVYDTAYIEDDRITRARLSYPAEWRDLWSPFAVILFNTFEPLSVNDS